MTKTFQVRQDVAVREERRSHPRHPSEQSVLVYWQDKRGLPHEATAVLKNMSARGFALELSVRFPVGGAVTVRTHERSLQCTVRHVQEQPAGFLAGLEVISLSDGTAWEQSLLKLLAALDKSIAK